MCDHGDSKNHKFLEFLLDSDAEVYMCECGVLIDMNAEKNYCDPTHPMTPQELATLVQNLIDERVDEIHAKVDKAFAG